MANFTVTNILDEDTFEVSPQWHWRGQTGSRVRRAGYDAPEPNKNGAKPAKQKLSRLILWKQVELFTAYRIDHGRLVCEVYFGGKNLTDYFHEHQ